MYRNRALFSGVLSGSSVSWHVSIDGLIRSPVCILQVSRNLPASLEEVLEEFQPPARSPTNLPDWMSSKAPLIRAQPLTGTWLRPLCGVRPLLPSCCWLHVSAFSSGAHYTAFHGELMSCAGLRMEDPMLPVPRFTPTVRKFRPQPIDLKDGLKKVKVGTPQPAAECRAFVLLSGLLCLPGCRADMWQG